MILTLAGNVLFSGLEPMSKAYSLLLQRTKNCDAQNIQLRFGIAELATIQPEQQNIINYLRGLNSATTFDLKCGPLQDVIQLLINKEIDFAFLPDFVAQECSQLDALPISTSRLLLLYDKTIFDGMHLTLKDLAQAPIIVALPRHRELLQSYLHGYNIDPVFSEFDPSVVTIQLSMQRCLFMTPENSFLNQPYFEKLELPGLSLEQNTIAWNQNSLHPYIELLRQKLRPA